MSIYLINYLPLFATWYCILQGQSFLFLVFVFLVIPLLETILPLPIEILQPRPKNFIDDIILFSWYPIELISLILFIYTKQYSFYDSLTMGLIIGLGINGAHELIHKGSSMHKWFGRRLLEFSGYGFWEWQHITFHHRNVGFLIDPATAPKGMTIYQFVPRCIIGTIKQALFSQPMRFIVSISLSFLNILIIFILFGYMATSFYISSACMGIIFLEMINYLEHYSLTRQPHEKVSEIHSWDAPYTWSSIFLYKLPFHSDHHMNASKSYPELRIRNNSPKLPYSYPVMLLASLIPPLFRKITRINTTNTLLGTNK